MIHLVSASKQSDLFTNTKLTYGHLRRIKIYLKETIKNQEWAGIIFSFC